MERDPYTNKNCDKELLVQNLTCVFCLYAHNFNGNLFYYPILF